jgi:nucleotide-binding universal stress UspA family protein
MTYQKILAALDRSEQSEVVFAKALTLAKQYSANLMVLHCFSLGDCDEALYQKDLSNNITALSPYYAESIKEVVEQEIAEIDWWLRSYCERAISRGVSAEWHCDLVPAGCAIRDWVQRWDADLVVMGRRGHKGLTEVLIGSVSNYVMHNAACSVLVVQ